MPRPPAARPLTGAGALVGLLVLVEFFSGTIQGSFPVLLPDLARSLHFDAGAQALVLGVNFLVAGVTVPLGSRLGDLLGHRRLLLVTLALTSLGFALSATATALPLLLVGQALAGVLACWLPLEFALLRDQLGEERGGRAVGLLVGALTLGTVAGAVVRPGLWILAALPAVSLTAVWVFAPESVTRAVGRFDRRGAALLATGLGLLFGGLGTAGKSGGVSLTAGLLLGAAAMLALFVRQELRCPTPTVDVRMLARRPTAPVFGLSLLLGFALYGAQSPTLSFQAAKPAEDGYGLGADSRLLGLLSLPAVLGAMLGALVADRLARRFGARALLAFGFAMSALGYAVIAASHGSAAAFVAPNAVAGFGAGLGLSLLPGLLMRRLPADRTGIGTGVYNTLKTLAGAAAGAVGAAVLDAVLLRPGVPSAAAYVTIWTACALLCALGVPVALALRATPDGATPDTREGMRLASEQPV
ncbi:MFS transporter [Streptacidiphilus pinicola]|uniref:MFS transporter n=1 Tax=Streptacidiphilus pinicola TaxID=2219663 RepID=A0A2X0KH08_9ACTN|nr:MFS transporter [Streptacidiphilus pinicola]RAG86060.1 MFS transporter [Streptacidiphilus pinicola]